MVGNDGRGQCCPVSVLTFTYDVVLILKRSSEVESSVGRD